MEFSIFIWNYLYLEFERKISHGSVHLKKCFYTLMQNKQLIWEEENRRLEELLRRKPCSPALPLVVVCPVPANERVEEHFVRRCLNIDDLILGGADQ